MMNDTIAIITARGGSKRIPGKNTRKFLGKPILQYSIEAALESGLFKEVMVSTDSDDIAAIAKQAGAIVPFQRSAKNADDFATTADVLIEVLNTYASRGQAFETGCCIYPTAPFVTADKLKKAYTLLKNAQADSVIPVSTFNSSIWRAYRMKEEKISYIWPEHANRRSQDLEPAYFDCGQFYFFGVKRFLEQRSLVTPNTYGIAVPETEVQDIDTESDWTLAELKYLYTFHRHSILSLINNTNGKNV